MIKQWNYYIKKWAALFFFQYRFFYLNGVVFTPLIKAKNPENSYFGVGYSDWKSAKNILLKFHKRSKQRNFTGIKQVHEIVGSKYLALNNFTWNLPEGTMNVLVKDKVFYGQEPPDENLLLLPEDNLWTLSDIQDKYSWKQL